MRSIHVNTHKIRPYIEKAYKADPELIAKWHITAGEPVEACIDRTFSDLQACKDLRFFTVSEYGGRNQDGAKFIGYFGFEVLPNGQGLYMPTVFVMPEFRDSPLKEMFWGEVEKKVWLISKETSRVWRAGCYTKNIPCVKFYQKKGVEVAQVSTPHGPSVIFQFESKGIV